MAEMKKHSTKSGDFPTPFKPVLVWGSKVVDTVVYEKIWYLAFMCDDGWFLDSGYGAGRTQVVNVSVWWNLEYDENGNLVEEL